MNDNNILPLEIIKYYNIQIEGINYDIIECRYKENPTSFDNIFEALVKKGDEKEQVFTTSVSKLSNFLIKK